MTADTDPSRRLFYALWPVEPERTRLVADFAPAIATAAGRPVPPANLHVTLAFLGLVPERRVAALRVLGASLVWTPVMLVFDRLDWWATAQAWVAGLRAPPPALLEYQASLETGLRAGGLRMDQKPYLPHLTLARKVRAAPSESPPIRVSWRPSEVALVESIAAPGGSRYVPLERWPSGSA